MVMETTDSCRSALTTLSTTLVFPDAVPPATPMKKGSCLVLGICMPKVITGKNTVVSARVTITASALITASGAKLVITALLRGAKAGQTFKRPLNNI